MAAVVDRKDYGSYKYQWARYVARKSLKREIDLLKKNMATVSKTTVDNLSGALPTVLGQEALPGLKLREIAGSSDQLTFGRAPTVPGQFHMGIIGSGCAGLFTAMLIDELNRRIPGFKITYDILEAGGQKRLGGRLYTHRFTKDPLEHQYYDVGAMRFPDNDVMNRTFRLFKYLDMKSDGPNPALRPYYFKDYDNVCPSYYNDNRIWGEPDFKKLTDPVTAGSQKERDPFKVNTWLPENDPNRISKDVIEYDPGAIVDRAIKTLTDKIQEDLDKEKAKQKSPLETDVPDEGWKTLMAADFMSVRQYLRSGKLPELGIDGCDYNFNTLEWLETYALATGWYDQSLSELVIDALDFGTPEVPEEGQDPNTPAEKIKYKNFWWCVEGGSQLIAERMAAKVTKQPEFNKQVTAIETDLLGTGNVNLDIKTTPPDGWDRTKTFESKTETRSYFTVFNSTTLGALQRMDLSKANLLYGTKQAIRSLRYGASCKVGIRFSRMWWKEAPFNITKGGLSHTDLPLRTCVYPSYNVNDKADKPAVLLCSYTWAQDAQRIGTLIDPASPAHEEELKNLMLSNLAQLHADHKDAGSGWDYDSLLKKLHEWYMDHHAYDWYHDSNMSGAFAYFGPGQFSQMWPEIIKPNGWLFFIGEAASAHHAWIVGALESAVRAVYQLMQLLREQAFKLKIQFSGYEQAMRFLEGNSDKPHDETWQLPFVGLPREIPVHQIDTPKDKKVQDLPEADIDLTFVAAQCISSFFEMAVQLAKEKEQAVQAVESKA